MDKKNQSKISQEKELISNAVLKTTTKDSIEASVSKNENKDHKQYQNLLKVGICAMEKKSKCKSMQEVLARLNALNEFMIIIFEEKMILTQPIETWPIVDCLIAFDSPGFPLARCKAYAELVNPYLLNDLIFQDMIKKRYKVYQILINHHIPVPKFYFVTNDKNKVKEYEEEDIGCLLNSQDYTPNSLHSMNSIKKIESIECLSLLSKGKIMKNHRNDELNVNHKHNSTSRKSSEMGEQPNYLDVNVTSDNFSQSSSSNEHKVPNNQNSENSLQDPISINSNQKNQSNEENFNRLTKKLSIKKFKFYHNSEIEEFDNHIMIGQNKLKKPFVEKPFDADDHNINIYYPQNDGGGCKRLFRKIGNTSSSFEPNNNQIRRDKEYIYEEFLPTEGFDIKVYTIGTDYAHAETRKSPVLDGKVLRTKEGKEVRYPVNLTQEEKIIAKKIVIAFRQQICGFDLLRSKGKSFVCDVNGLSFVKGNKKYYTDCAILLRKMIWAKFCPEKVYAINSILSLPDQASKNPINLLRPDRVEKNKVNEELRSVVAVFRHGDRTPKQKMKMTTRDPRFLSFFDNQSNLKKELKLKTEKQLKKILDIAKEILSQMYAEGDESNLDTDNEKYSKLTQILSVLDKIGQFEGFNRKIQLKPVGWSDNQFDSNTKVNEVLLIMKWGGELTHSGVEQAIELGAHFRGNVYPNDNEGVLRLHSTYRHDMKIYSSDEGRCQKTAAAFTKGLLDLEGELTPILVGLVRKDDVIQELLDVSKSDEINPKDLSIRETLSKFLNCNGNLYENIKDLLGEGHIYPSMKSTLIKIGNPLTLMKKVLKKLWNKEYITPYNLIKQVYGLMKQLTIKCREILSTDQKSYYIKPKDMESSKHCGDYECDQEPMILIYKRWSKLENDFYDKKKGIYDVSKIPDVYYSIRYDILHNKEFANKIPDVCRELFESIRFLADFVIPGQFGITIDDKVSSSYEIISNLLKKIKNDLIWWNRLDPKEDELILQDELSFLSYKGLDITKINGEIKSAWRHVRSRLYFTSASHLYSLFNIINFGFESYLVANTQKQFLQELKSLDFLSHILIKLYENLNASTDDPKRFRLELSVSQGCAMQSVDDVVNHKAQISDRIIINSQLTLSEIEQFFNFLYNSINKKEQNV